MVLLFVAVSPPPRVMHVSVPASCPRSFPRPRRSLPTLSLMTSSLSSRLCQRPVRAFLRPQVISVLSASWSPSRCPAPSALGATSHRNTSFFVWIAHGTNALVAWARVALGQNGNGPPSRVSRPFPRARPEPRTHYHPTHASPSATAFDIPDSRVPGAIGP